MWDYLAGLLVGLCTGWSIGWSLRGIRGQKRVREVLDTAEVELMAGSTDVAIRQLQRARAMMAAL